MRPRVEFPGYKGTPSQDGLALLLEPALSLVPAPSAGARPFPRQEKIGHRPRWIDRPGGWSCQGLQSFPLPDPPLPRLREAKSTGWPKQT
ncbi:hypothetical protein LZ31DRAFT_560913 [Colletotrichum somersetense]|nr:hypothetical protein LZ31DRAFT_560913 [Colletotrichum somersetense]